MRVFWVLAFLLLVVPARAAEAGAWTIVAKESALGFVATQEGQETEGGFKTFGGTIVFDKDQPEAARLDIEIDMASVSSSHDDVPATLKTTPWFDVAKFPKARYVATGARADGKGGFLADGKLTIRGVTVPVSVAFRFDAYGPKPGAPATLRAVAKGTATLQRTAFGVGQGEWASTSIVADPVQVKFALVAEKPGTPEIGG